MVKETQPSDPAILAGIPYLKSDLDHLDVEFAQRILGEELIDRRDVPVHDGRRASAALSLDCEGFELVDAPCAVVHEDMDGLTATGDVFDFSAAQRRYWLETVPLIKTLSGAREVIPLHASAVRRSQSGGKGMTPAGWAHLDYETVEAEEQLRKAFVDNQVEPRPFGRFVLYQGWRALSDPPQDVPLALCDGRTVASEDIVPIRYHLAAGGQDVTYRTSGSRFSPRHRWWYFPDMTIDEMIIFKGYDSALGDDFRTLHVAFADRTADNPVPRTSIETRYFALFD